MLNDDDFALFREAAQGTKKIEQNTFVPKTLPRQKVSDFREQQEQKDTEFFFSDEYEPLLKEENEKVKYLREGVDPIFSNNFDVVIFSPNSF